ncbi:hypothetical protein LCGC14_0969400 [marine sediment metagenome]|uniref:Uncharacterized protein n=1 Tax=marine sediment metagenome TaxID=412755 RepID=A0A0F9NC67_9ZZZZ
MQNSSIPEKIKNSVINSNQFITSDDLAQEFNIKKRTALNYLSRLEREGKLTRIGRDGYINSQKTKLKLEIDPEIERIHNFIKDSSPYLDFKIWSIFNLKNFFHNIPIKNYIFIETKELFELKSIKDRLFEQNFESLINPKLTDFEEVFYRKEIPIFLFKRKNQYGIVKIKEIETAISERCVLDLYYYVTRRHLNFPIDELKDIMTNMIQTGEFNFSFAMRYARIRNIEFEILLIFLKLKENLPNYIPSKFLNKHLP